MAKKQTYIPPMSGDANLIKGAGFAAQGYVQDVGQNVFAGDRSDEIRQQKQVMSQQADARMASFMENMPANVDIAKVPPQLQSVITPFLTDTKEEYFRFAQTAANAGPRSPQYTEAIQGMNTIMQQYQNLNNDLTKLYDKKIQTIEDFELGKISNGTTAEAKDFMTRLTTDEIDLNINRGNGRLLLGENMTIDNLPKMHYKDYESASKILNLHSTLYEAGAPLDAGRENIVRMQLRAMMDQGGPQATVSLATDDYIVPGGLGIDPSQYTPQELKDVVIDQYVNVMRQSAQSGYNAIVAKENRHDDRMVARNARIKTNSGQKGSPSMATPGAPGQDGQPVASASGLPSYLAGTAFDVEPSNMTKEMVARHNDAISYFNDSQRKVQELSSLSPGTVVEDFIGQKYNGKEIKQFKVVGQSNKTIEDPFAPDSKFVEITVVDKTLTETPTIGPNRGQKSVVDVTSVVKLDLNNLDQTRMFVKNYLENQYGTGATVDKAIQMTGDYNRGINSLPNLQDALDASSEGVSYRPE
jgi:hypothetical protein